MASTLKVDNLQTQDGDSYNVVSWDTTAKTAAFTAVSGKGYFVDTSSAAITVTLPASPSAGDIVRLKDYNGSFGTNSCTVARNGSNIRGATNDFALEKNNSGAVFVYVDATEGWQVFVDGADIDAQRTFIVASGGTETTCGDFKIHTFTGPGTFSVSSIGCAAERQKVDYMVVAGGGGGGAFHRGGGGGAGGFRESQCSTTSGCYTASPLASSSSLPVCAQDYPITVGAGGGGGSAPAISRGSAGANSVFSTITSAGGGAGGGGEPGSTDPLRSGNDGGSGGGAGSGSTPNLNGGTGNTPPVTPPQGNNGGPASGGANQTGAGGGGATVAGTTSPPASPQVAPGGNGATTSITGSSVAYAGGGGGGAGVGTCVSCGPVGGTGGGGDGGRTPSSLAQAGTANTGGGGGGAGSTTCAPFSGASGGSGIVIIRYKYQ